MVKVYDNDESIIGVTGPILPLWENPSMNWFPREFYWMFSCTYYDSKEPMEVKMGMEQISLFERKLLTHADYFSTDWEQKGRRLARKTKTYSEETEFSIRVKRKTGKSIIYHPHVSVYHKVYQYRLKTVSLIWRGFELGYTKAVFNRNFSEHRSKDKILNTEYTLLKRIFLTPFPVFAKTFFIILLLLSENPLLHLLH